MKGKQIVLPSHSRFDEWSEEEKKHQPFFLFMVCLAIQHLARSSLPTKRGTYGWRCECMEKKKVVFLSLSSSLCIVVVVVRIAADWFPGAADWFPLVLFSVLHTYCLCLTAAVFVLPRLIYSSYASSCLHFNPSLRRILYMSPCHTRAMWLSHSTVWSTEKKKTPTTITFDFILHGSRATLVFVNFFSWLISVLLVDSYGFSTDSHKMSASELKVKWKDVGDEFLFCSTFFSGHFEIFRNDIWLPLFG